MKIWTVSKKTILIIFSVLIAICIIAGVITEKSVSASAAKKKLPIYAVETDEKKVAITFDAAWTN